jgi:diguanylate cyclase (GGDEF)-like protein/PAS domain S-box-containing protein
MNHSDDEARAAALQRRLERERRARLESEAIAERTTRELWETVQALQRSQSERDAATALALLLQRALIAANQSTELEDAAEQVLADVCRYTGWPVGHLYVVDRDRLVRPTPRWHVDDPSRFASFQEVTAHTRLLPGEGLPGRVVTSGAPAWINDVTMDGNFPRAAAAASTGLRAAFAFPVLLGREVAAVLEFFAESALERDERLLDVMGHVGRQLGRVVERERAHEAVRASEEQLRLVIDTAHDAFIAIDSGSVILDWNRQAEQIFGWSRDEVLGRRLTETIIPPAYRDVHLAGLAHFTLTGIAPVLGRRLELSALDRTGREFPIELTPWAIEIDGEVRFNAFVHDISERKALQRQLEHQALHDPLTSLANRTLFLDRVHHALTRGRRDSSWTALLFVDLDRFKAVNDSMGHEAGDQLLLGVAARIRGALRPADTLARLGGDEFVALCETLGDRESVHAIARRIIAALDAPFVLPAGEAFISASVGIALSHGGPEHAEELLANADIAMYRAKKHGPGRCEVFDDTMRAGIEERVELERSLRRALEDGDELFVLYQPIVDLPSGCISGVEALLRWRRPGHGVVSAGDFIPLAEDTGLIVPMGQLVLDETCGLLDEIRVTPTEIPFTAAVNVSLRQVEQAGFVNDVLETLAKHDVEPERLVLEVTEGMFLHDGRPIVQRLWELHEMGFRVALDDFGTSYSSLDRLRRLPVDMLKIDKSFVSELDTTTGGTPLVAAIIAMSHSLGLTVVAEGIESIEQARALAAMGCNRAQGHLLSPPITRDELIALLADPLHHRPIVQPAGDDAARWRDIEPKLRELVIDALTVGHDPERTTRSLMTELERIVAPRDA